MKKLFPLVAIAGVAFPAVTFATDADAFSILGTIATFLSYVTPVLVTIAVIFFIWTVIKYTMTKDEAQKKKAKDNIVPALIGLFIMVAFWGILTVVSNTFGIGPEQLDERDIPCVPNSAAGIYCD